MNEQNSKSQSSFGWIFGIVAVCLFAVVSIPNFVGNHCASPANACINNLRQIDAAKNEWAIEHHAKSDDVVTLEDIKPYFVRYGAPNGFIFLDAKGNLPKCPSGGIYTIGKVGEVPTCSIGTNDIIAHALIP